MTAKELDQRLYLDSSTLTPVLRSLEEKGLSFPRGQACFNLKADEERRRSAEGGARRPLRSGPLREFQRRGNHSASAASLQVAVCTVRTNHEKTSFPQRSFGAEKGALPLAAPLWCLFR